MKRIVSLKKTITCFMLLFSLVSFAQTKVKGVVMDIDNNPLPFCNVLFKNTTVGTVTDENGCEAPAQTSRASVFLFLI